MALIRTLSTAVLLTSLVLPLFIQGSYSFKGNVSQPQAPISDADFVELILNLEYYVAEFFLFGAMGRGLDAVAPELAKGGPHPIGGTLANLNPFYRDVFKQFAFQKIGHLRVINREVKGFPRPLLDISKKLFTEIADRALGQTLNPPFNPYANSLNYLLASYAIADIGLPGYVGITPKLQNATYKRLVAGLLGEESGQFSVIRAYLYEIKDSLVPPYNVTVAEFTNRISEFGNRLGKAGIISEGLVVPKAEGAEGKVSGNVIAGDKDSLAFAKDPSVVLRIAYGTGNESVPGTLFPSGANGRIARSYLSVSG